MAGSKNALSDDALWFVTHYELLFGLIVKQQEIMIECLDEEKTLEVSEVIDGLIARADAIGKTIEKRLAEVGWEGTDNMEEEHHGK